MNKQHAAIILAVIGAVGGILAGGAAYSFDFSSTTIGQIGDNIINNYLADQGIDIDGFREMCRNGEVDAAFEKYCGLI
jgi:hypothetical protein